VDSRDKIMLNHIRNASLGALAVLALAAPAPAQSCAGDLNNDGVINGADLGQLLAAWGPCQSCEADLNANGVVDGADLGVQLANWGECVTIPIPTWATVVQAQPDPAVVTDPALRTAIIATGRPWRVRDTATQVEMLLVPPGTFQMGCIMGSDEYGCFSHEQPVHQVTLTNAFYLGRYEVTQSQWVAKMGSNPSSWQGASALVPADQVPNRPVESVSWNTIQGYLSATGFRLPTEAEWEYACRAGTQTPFYNGSTDDTTLGTLAWYQSNSGFQTRAVGGKLANAFGFHDMLGNVYEWVNDRYGLYTADAQTDPTGPVSASSRVIRGCGWLGVSGCVRSSNRSSGSPVHTTSGGLGFRVARNP
jgi:formylglycine-generating enzyme required for sulfatase activity